MMVSLLPGIVKKEASMSACLLTVTSLDVYCRNEQVSHQSDGLSSRLIISVVFVLAFPPSFCAVPGIRSDNLLSIVGVDENFFCVLGRMIKNGVDICCATVHIDYL